jgi:hypothetical protein
MKASASKATTPRVGPYCRALQDGAGAGFDGRSKEGKFIRRCEAELLAQIGREPTFAERLLVRRISRLNLQAELLDARLASGQGFSAHDGRTYGGIQNAIRNALKDLGLKPAPTAKTPSPLAAHFANPPAREARG